LIAHIRSRNYQLTQLPDHVRQAAANQIMAGLNPAPAQPVQYPPQPPMTAAYPPPGLPEAPASIVPVPSSVAAFAPQYPAPAPTAGARPPGPVLSEFGIRFNAAGNRHAAWVAEQIEAFLAFLPIGEGTVDRVSRRYRQSGREVYVDGLGTLSPTGVWTWAWADDATWTRDTAITEQSRRLRALGERDGIVELTTPDLDLSQFTDEPDAQAAAEMLARTAMGLLTARGYIGHGAAGEGGGRIYYVVCDTSVPEVRPSLGTMPRFLMEGSAAFGGDATECVLGYVEHHGWEWSRVPDGILVAAEGVGSFTAEISPEGRVTGLSLHT
jgi:hypothetical protein